MKSLHHNGVLVPPKYQACGLTARINGAETKLTPEQEEMTVAWAKKIGTPYIDDEGFAHNFHEDFSEKLGRKVEPGQVDYSGIHRLVVMEREAKLALSTEEKKVQAVDRKAAREANKEKYGYALVDGERIELGNYMAEPNSIFMGRGKHPWRGRWKEGPDYQDIELNLSPDAPLPPGAWKAVLWEPGTMWIARWRDRLSARMKQRNGEEPGGKMKYVWPGDASTLKQRKDLEKYEKAKVLRDRLGEIKDHIERSLDSTDIRRRRVATVAYLIDRLKFRVGDEKNEDEADTVGASTIGVDHLVFYPNEEITFDFLGKDSVRFEKTEKLDPKIVRNLIEFAREAEEKYVKRVEAAFPLGEAVVIKAKNASKPLFEDVNSSQVGDFLKEVMEGLSAKVFRTCYATGAVEGKLNETKLPPDAPDYVKRHAAAEANLEAAVVCNHKRTVPKTWEQSLKNKRDRLRQLQEKERSDDRELRARARTEEDKYRARVAEAEKKLEAAEAKQDEMKKAKAPEAKLKTARDAAKAARERVRKLKNEHVASASKQKALAEDRRRRNHEASERMRLQVDEQEQTKDYNLGTSLKNYVDPRIYYDWGRKIGYDWKKYYPATLQKKFSWLDKEEEE
jgi:DNA topoisomerase-1